MSYPDRPSIAEQPEWHLWYGAFDNVLQGDGGFGLST